MPIEWFVTTASQSRIWLKLLSDDSNKIGICLLCRSTQLHATTSCRSQFATTCDSSYVLQSSTPYWKSTTLLYSVLQSTNPVLLCTTQCYSSTTLYYKVLLQYYSVLRSTTPVLLCTTKYYSSTTVLQSTTPVLLCTAKYYSSTTLYYTVLLQYYKVLLQYYSVLQSTTKYYSSTTLYYKVLLQYYSVLQSTSPVLLCTTPVLLQYYSVQQSNTHAWSSSHLNVIDNARRTKRHAKSSSHMKRDLQCAEHQVSWSNAPNTAPATKNDSHHSRHIWNVIYNARSNMCHPPTSPNTAPATQKDSHDGFSSHMKRYLQCAEQQMSSSNITEYCACHAKWLSSLILVTYETLFTMRGVTSVIVQTHQILRLPRKMNLMIDPCHTWNAIYNARSNKCHCPNSPNTAPATKNESHDWSLSHMKRYLQCAEQQVSLSKLTKYCAWHTKWLSWLILVTYETLFTMRGTTDGILQHHRILRLPRKLTLETFCWNVISNAGPIREWSENDPRMIRPWSDHDPTMKPSLRNPPRNRGYFSRPPRAFCIEKYNISRSGYHSKLHRILRLPRKVTLQLHQILRLPQKMNLMIDPCHTWNAIYNARSNKCHCPNSPNTAPATKNESHDWSLSHMKRYLQCAEQQVSLSKLTKYCAWHTKWLSWLILVTYETLFTMRGTTDGRHPPTSPNTAPATQIDSWNFLLKCHFQCGADPRMIREWSDHETVTPQPASQPRLLFTPTTSILYWKIQRFAIRLSFQTSPNTAPATKSDTSTSPNTAPATKSDTWTSPNSAPATKSDTWTSANKAMTWMSYYLTEPLLDWAMTWLSYDLTELWLDWAMTWPSYDLTELTWLSYDLTELWFD